jgi:cytochrome P450
MKPIEINGRVYPTGTRLVPTAYLVHHNPEIYPDPYAFRPERFLENPPGNYTWIPFGGGRRRCLGKAIGESELKYVLREILSRYELHAEDPRPVASTSHTVVMRPVKGTRVALVERSRKIALATA